MVSGTLELDSNFSPIQKECMLINLDLTRRGKAPVSISMCGCGGKAGTGTCYCPFPSPLTLFSRSRRPGPCLEHFLWFKNINHKYKAFKHCETVNG